VLRLGLKQLFLQPAASPVCEISTSRLGTSVLPGSWRNKAPNERSMSSAAACRRSRFTAWRACRGTPGAASVPPPGGVAAPDAAHSRQTGKCHHVTATNSAPTAPARMGKGPAPRITRIKCPQFLEQFIAALPRHPGLLCVLALGRAGGHRCYHRRPRVHFVGGEREARAATGLGSRTTSSSGLAQPLRAVDVAHE